MVLDPERHRAILEYLNVGYSPFRYRDLERLAAFQNRVFAKYAAEHNLAFLDVSKWMPRDPNLFIDAIHGTPEGVRLRGWVMFQLLVPLIERHLRGRCLAQEGFPPGASSSALQTAADHVRLREDGGLSAGGNRRRHSTPTTRQQSQGESFSPKLHPAPPLASGFIVKLHL